MEVEKSILPAIIIGNMNMLIHKLAVLLLLFVASACSSLSVCGQDIWSRCYGGSKMEWGTMVAPVPGGGYVITGGTWSTDGDFSGMAHGEHDIFVVRVNAAGEILWRHLFGGSKYEFANCIISTPDAGFILSGNTYSNDGDFAGMNRGEHDIFVIKLNANGQVEWKKTYGGSGDEDGVSTLSTADGGFIIAGETWSADGDFKSSRTRTKPDIYVMKLSAFGALLWTSTYGGSGYDRAESIVLADGGYVLAGDTESNDGDFLGMNHGKRDVFVMKIDSTAKVLWKHCYGGSEIDRASAVTQSNSSGYAIAGWTHSNDADFSGGSERTEPDAFVLKLDATGALAWKRMIGGSKEDRAFSVIPAGDGGVVCTGGTWSDDGDFAGIHKGLCDIFLVKIDSSGNSVWARNYGGKLEEDQGYNIAATSDGGFAITGTTDCNDGDFAGLNKGTSDAFILKVDGDASQLRNDSLFVYPNIVTNSTTVVYSTTRTTAVRVEILNVLGAVVAKLADGLLPAGTYNESFLTTELPSGSYIVRLTTTYGNVVAKMIVVR